jgi:hypothetical protein
MTPDLTFDEQPRPPTVRSPLFKCKLLEQDRPPAEAFLTGALGDVREEYGEEFADKMVRYAFRAMKDYPTRARRYRQWLRHRETEKGEMIDAEQLQTLRDTARTTGLVDLLVRIERNIRHDPTHHTSKELLQQALTLLGVTDEQRAA